MANMRVTPLVMANNKVTVLKRNFKENRWFRKGGPFVMLGLLKMRASEPSELQFELTET